MRELGTEVNGANHGVGEEQLEDAIGKGWAERDREPDEGFADLEVAAVKVDLGIGLHPADL